jgi:hypothetical protein
MVGKTTEVVDTTRHSGDTHPHNELSECYHLLDVVNRMRIDRQLEPLMFNADTLGALADSHTRKSLKGGQVTHIGIDSRVAIATSRGFRDFQEATFATTLDPIQIPSSAAIRSTLLSDTKFVGISVLKNEQGLKFVTLCLAK